MSPHDAALATLGWTDWFAARRDCGAGETVARVAAVNRDLLVLVDGAGSFHATLAGGYRYRHHEAHEQPCVGDWVCVERPAGSDLGRVRAILERRTVLRRKVAGDDIDVQMIASNVDHVVIVQSSHHDFNVNRLERYLVMVWDGGAEPHILLTKTDLVSPEVVLEQRSAIAAAGILAPVFNLSNVTRDGMDELQRLLVPGRTYCFVGSSGVGKSTLINHLIGRDVQETQGVSATGEGRHTTVRRELIVLSGGALVIDNPGMREFGIAGAEEGLALGFGDIDARAADCRYRDCTHVNEPGCAVRDAVGAGEIDREHYENYLKLRKESAFYDMSYAERRKRDRAFGKMIHASMKGHKKG